MNTQITVKETQTLAQVGQVANQYAAQNVFNDYLNRKAKNTLRRQRADLALFTEYLNQFQIKPTDLQTNPESWRGVTWGLVEGFREWQLQHYYAVRSVNVRLSTVKKYAALAFKAGVISTDEHAQIRAVTGFTFQESKHVDEKREAEGINIRRVHKNGKQTVVKKAEAVVISPRDANTLKREQPATAQGRRDALLMCLLLDHGLRCGEIARLMVGNFSLTDNTMTFYRPKVDKTQTHELTADTRRALLAYVTAGDCPTDLDAKLLRGSNKGGRLTTAHMSERAITKRVNVLGAQVGLAHLSAHDGRHSWATRAARNGTDPFALQEAGGWNSLAMPRRYVEDAKIANEGVKLD